jgi:hypothetical protein
MKLLYNRKGKLVVFNILIILQYHGWYIKNKKLKTQSILKTDSEKGFLLLFNKINSIIMKVLFEIKVNKYSLKLFIKTHTYYFI